jgi:hypothetical protein
MNSILGELALRLGEGAVWCPVMHHDPVIHLHERQAQFPAPLSERLDFATPLYAAIVPAIIGLLNFCGPAHVARLVVSVHVDAVNRVVPRRLLAYVCQKGREVISPFIADVDTTTAVVQPSLVSWIRAALLGVTPRNPFHCAGLVVRPLAISGQFTIQASAALHQALLHIAAAGVVGISAIASADPLIALVGVVKRYKAAEAVSGDVEQWSAHFSLV